MIRLCVKESDVQYIFIYSKSKNIFFAIPNVPRENSWITEFRSFLKSTIMLKFLKFRNNEYPCVSVGQKKSQCFPLNPLWCKYGHQRIPLKENTGYPLLTNSRKLTKAFYSTNSVLYLTYTNMFSPPTNFSNILVCR